MQTWLNSMIYHGINIESSRILFKKRNICHQSLIKNRDFLFKDLNTKIFKISSGEITNLNFLKYCAKKSANYFEHWNEQRKRNI